MPTIKEYVKEEIFREPHRSWRYWLILFGGCFVILFALSYPLDNWAVRSLFSIMGLMLIFSGAAELLPRNQTTLAGLLRIGHFVALFSMILLIGILSLVSR